MRDGGRHATQAGHTIGLLQTFLQPLPLRDVLKHLHDAGDLIAFIDGRDAVFHGKWLARFAPEDFLRNALDTIVQRLQYRAIGGGVRRTVRPGVMNGVMNIGGSLQLPDRETSHGSGRWIDQKRLAPTVDRHDSFRRILQNQLALMAEATDRRFGGLPLRHVEHPADHANGAARTVSNDDGAIEHVAEAAVAALETICARPPRLPFDGPAKRFQDHRPIFGMDPLLPPFDGDLIALQVVTPHGLERFVEPHLAAGDIPIPDHFLRGLGGVLESFLASA